MSLLTSCLYLFIGNRERSRSPRRVANAEYTASPLEVTPVNQSAEVYHVGHKEEPEIIAVIDPSGT